MSATLKYEGDWKGFDRGREGHFDPGPWRGVLEILAEHEGTLIRDTRSKMYRDLEKKYPETEWISPKDSEHNFFRDYQTAWTLTGVLVPTRSTNGIVRLTPLGRAFIDGKLSLNAVWTQAMACHQESGGDRPFAVLASAFLALRTKNLSIAQIFYGIERNWRPLDGLPLRFSPSLPKHILSADRTPARRLRAMLKLLTSVEALRFNGTHWAAHNDDVLTAIANKTVILGSLRQSKKTALTPPENRVEKEIATFAELQDESASPIREMIMRSIAVRRGQPRFRKTLLGLYDHKCAISRWDATVALEAAHISPVSSQGNHEPSNGILLRADLHTLFDLHYIAINPTTLSVVVSQKLKKTRYADFDGERLHLPLSITDRPSRTALAKHYKSFLTGR